jgi:uncharacterized membrane protein (DUF4010 family)
MTALDAAPDAILVLRNLGIAVTAGFVIGFEREWTQSLEKQEHTFAGARTFALIGMVGGLAGLLSDGPLIAAAALLVIGALTIAGYWFEAKETPGRGGTTEMAIVVTLLLGVAAGRGFILLAAAGAVTTAIVLSLKSAIKGWASALNQNEIHATLRFLAISVLILPVLPNEQFGPYGALNPRELWTMVVMISGLSFLGYWLVKIMGEGRGVLLTGAVGGLASSTATTLSLSKFARDGISPPAAVAAGVVIANVVMMIRVGVILIALSRPVFAEVAPALGAGALAGAILAGVLWRTALKERAATGVVAVGNPFELRPAIYFAAMIAVISIASSYGVETFGAAGAYAVGAISGLADVDAMTLSGGRQAATGNLAVNVAAGAILLAVASNVIVKGVMAYTVGGAGSGVRVIAAFVFVIAAGALAYFLV